MPTRHLKAEEFLMTWELLYLMPYIINKWSLILPLQSPLIIDTLRYCRDSDIAQGYCPVKIDSFFSNHQMCPPLELWPFLPCFHHLSITLAKVDAFVFAPLLFCTFAWLARTNL